MVTSDVLTNWPSLVIAGLDPAIHPLLNDSSRSLMDARIKSGHDDRRLDTNILP
jgi:hypothetical protein